MVSYLSQDKGDQGKQKTRKKGLLTEVAEVQQ